MSARVSTPSTAGSAREEGCATCRLVPDETGSELGLDVLTFEAGGEATVSRGERDALLFVVAGSGAVDRDGNARGIETGCSAIVLAGSEARVRAGAHGLELVVASVGPACDLHAPMGGVSGLERLDAVEPGKATGSRSFQVLYDPANGSTRATLFVGHIPPGRAPWHYHLYDEIVWVLAGEGRLHIGDAVEPLAPGSAFRLHPREIHIVENTQPDRELSVLGLFTPAGSPSAAYLQPDVFVAYVASAR